MLTTERLAGSPRIVFLASFFVVVVGSAQTESEQPSVSNPFRPTILSMKPALADGELLGFDFDDNLRYRDGVAIVRVAKRFTLTLHWLPKSARFSDSVSFIRVFGAGPAITQTYPIGVAITSLGTVVTQECSFEIPRFTHAGNGKLVIGLVGENGTELPLYAGPIRAAQIITTSTCTDAQIQEKFGLNTTRLKASFRLGPGAKVRVIVPESVSKAVTGFGLVSGLVYGDADQGEPVCYIEPSVRDARRLDRVFVEAGISTALENYDNLRPGTHRSRRIEIFDSWTVDELLNWRIEPYTRHRYVGRVALPKPADLESLEIRYVRTEGMIDIREIVLLHDSTTADEKGTLQ